MTSGRVLVVDDEQGVRSTLSAVLRDEGFDVETAQSGEECLSILEERSFQAILLDVWLPGRDGLDTLRTLRRTGVDAAVIMISGHGTIETAVRATKLGAHDFVEKPLSLEKIVLALRNALRARKLEERNRLLREELRRDTQMVGASESMRRVRERIEAAAPTGGGVLITGENGVGKELAARLIHAKSPRSEEAFIEVSCATVPPGRQLAELFGRAGGAEGTVVKAKLELADEGTLFLDEVWALTDEAQHRLLLALETGRFLPVDGHVPLACSVRPIASSERDLAAEVAAGRFREDLYLTLNVVPLAVPPLRERNEDIPLLVEHFLERYAREYARGVKTIGPAAMQRLARHLWPGNVRELRNVVERLVILAPGETIASEDLPAGLMDESPIPWPIHSLDAVPLAAAVKAAGSQGEEAAPWPAEPMAPQTPPSSGPRGPLPTLLAGKRAFEKDFILRRLEDMRWNVSKTAGSLGIERSNLYRKMKAYGIRPGGERKGQPSQT